MQRLHEPTTRSMRRLVRARLLAFCAAFVVIGSGCAGTTRVVSECPRPNTEEQDDLENFMTWEPDRPAALYMARVLGHIYGLELEEVRDE